MSPAVTKPGAPMPAAQLLRQAAMLFSEGRFEQAEPLYRRLLKLNPRASDLLRQIGICRLRLGDGAGALKRFEEALKLDPHSADGYAWRGHAFGAMGRLPEAVKSYERAVSCDARHFDAHYHRAAALEQLREPYAALASYETALALDPKSARARSGHANALGMVGRIDEAIVGYERAIALDPHFVDAHVNLSSTQLFCSRFALALESLERALRLRPDHPGATAIRPRILEGLGRYAEALAALEPLLRSTSADSDAWQMAGRILTRLRRADEALNCLDRALALAPADRAAAFARGLALAQLGRMSEVLQIFDGLLQAEPNDALALVNRGYAQIQLGRYYEGRTSIERALSLRPDQPRGRFQLALLDLTMGDYARGWEGYELRWFDSQSTLKPPALPMPRWSGAESLAGRTVLIYAEQGLGDTIQFTRFIPILAKRAARVVYDVPAQLRTLLQRDLPDNVEVIAPGDGSFAIDVQCPLLSLPLALGITLPSIPAPQQYLHADPDRLAAWRRRLGPDPRIGLVWSGSPTHANDRNRSISLSQLAPLFVSGRRFVSLQETVRSADAITLAALPGLEFVGDDFEDFEDTAAVATLCDLVIAVDTSAAHLAAALGRPVWLLVPFVPDWRWMLGRTDSPWYPSLRIFRQTCLGEWDDVIAQISAELSKHA